MSKTSREDGEILLDEQEKSLFDGDEQLPTKKYRGTGRLGRGYASSTALRKMF